jgi:glycosyltransferase involved in cell wall biosynthesis
MTISIFMPMHNALPFLGPCLDSILAQDDEDWELIIVNDHSTDGSTEVAERFVQKDDRITLIHSGSRGIPAALTAGMARSTGSLIHRMDADDIMPEGKLSKLRTVLRPGSVATGLVEYFSEEGVGQGYQRFAKTMNEVLIEHNWRTKAFRECFLPSPNWLMYRSDLEAIGGLDARMMPEDYDLFMRVLGSDLKVKVVPEVTHLWRDSDARTSRTQDIYHPLSYIPLKVHYFLKDFRDTKRPLVLYGAGNRGKKMAQELIRRNAPFHWVTSNERKWAAPIYGELLKPNGYISRLEKPQVLLSISSPDERPEVTKEMASYGLNEGSDYWWFC